MLNWRFQNKNGTTDWRGTYEFKKGYIYKIYMIKGRNDNLLVDSHVLLNTCKIYFNQLLKCAIISLYVCHPCILMTLLSCGRKLVFLISSKKKKKWIFIKFQIPISLQISLAITFSFWAGNITFNMQDLLLMCGKTLFCMTEKCFYNVLCEVQL
jgi:hypothetical protein